MSRIELADEVGDDFDRILEHLAQYQVENSMHRIQEIIEALNVLEHNPLIGRPVNNDKRELVIGRGSHGYMALYRYIAEIDTIFVLAVRSQREAGYTIPAS
ncbi:type II toxin-antitoxin system RelE/ParE family toxin [Eoetvoesiella caeni]|uniref:ParE-like toxin of type II ParDE toxin-antitoxin system n=1 Tax=Eoetvoesiella caeni TaxID=645616 RepID=A0A366HJ91_9BURK|nr:type II toxin-antitoxin system RelE/ParE family toxin [Eoetvoesiella caeni]MCI2807563.1 type II toxin-antitoxin system RelE/ParE family toxin [Eoetvoesiella caeni]NYT53042.1 type II toxin-antitoxin system RelE/ParE family toxin [Eoetvoesiella caeni]RBP43019.1 ParE-like toxin of type II ParDE toxin-antitoxin system [Eoetvoesiella caeni]